MSFLWSLIWFSSWTIIKVQKLYIILKKLFADLQMHVSERFLKLNNFISEFNNNSRFCWAFESDFVTLIEEFNFLKSLTFATKWWISSKYWSSTFLSFFIKFVWISYKAFSLPFLPQLFLTFADQVDASDHSSSEELWCWDPQFLSILQLDLKLQRWY